jgi:hypothetical protein
MLYTPFDTIVGMLAEETPKMRMDRRTFDVSGFQTFFNP